MNCLRKNGFLSRINLSDTVFFIGFLCVAVLFAWKAPLEIQGQDEAFYLTIPNRLLAGDIFFVDEWHGSQLAAFFTFPLLWLHRLVFGYDALLLHFRYAYIFFQALCTAVIYLRLRKYGIFGVLASLFFFLFTPFDIMTLSYNTIGLMLVALTAVLLATAQSRKALWISGFLFAGAVLCCPHLLGAYAVYSAVVLILAAKEKKKDPAIQWLLFTIGSACMALLLLLFIFSRASISRLLRSIPMLFTDPDHQSRPLLWTFGSYARHVLTLFSLGYVYALVYCAALLAAILDKRRRAHRAIYLIIAVVLTAAMLLELAPTAATDSYNFIMLPLAATGLMAYLISEEKDHNVFLFLFLGGLAYSICIFFSSNTRAYALTAAYTVTNVGSILLIGRVLAEMKQDKKAFCIVSAMMAVLMLAQFSLMVHTKINHKFWSFSDNRSLTQVIQEGPYKGIHVTPKTEALYLEQLRMLQPMTGKEGGILYVTSATWYYLATPELNNGAFSAWLSLHEEHACIDRLDLYYSVNPEKIPDYILISEPTERDMDYLKANLLDKYGYQPIEYPGAIVYRKT